MHADRFRFPSGHHYRYYRRGEFFPHALIRNDYFISDYLALGLSGPAYGQHWVRFGPDALLIDDRSGEVIDTVYGVYDEGDDTPPPPQDEEAVSKIFDNWNTAGCNFTDTASLDVNQPLQLDKVELWLNWQANEQSVTYKVYFNGNDFGDGTLVRTECDPYQTAWCGASDSPQATLDPGHYEFVIDHPALCQNSGSGGQGFIRVWGSWIDSPG